MPKSKIEEWKQVKGWPYEVSNYGRVRRNGRAKGAVDGKIKKLYIDKFTGYFKVGLNRAVGNPVSITKSVHELVCTAFCGTKRAGQEVRHLNGVYTDNFYLNLKWGTSFENSQDMKKHGRNKIGSKHPFAKITERDVIRMRSKYDKVKKPGVRVSYGFVKSLAKEYGIARGTIGKIVNRSRWTHI